MKRNCQDIKEYTLWWRFFFFTFSHLLQIFFFSTFFTFTTPSFIHILYYSSFYQNITILPIYYTMFCGSRDWPKPLFFYVRPKRNAHLAECSATMEFFSAIGRSLFCAVREIGKVSLSKWQKNIIIIIRLPLFLCLQTLPKSWGCQHLWWGQPRLESIKTVLCDMLHSEFFWVFKFFDKILPLKVTQYGSIIFMYLE